MRGRNGWWMEIRDMETAFADLPRFTDIDGDGDTASVQNCMNRSCPNINSFDDALNVIALTVCCKCHL